MITFDKEALEEVGIKLTHFDFGFTLCGTDPIPEKVIKAIQFISDELELTDRDCDQLLDYAGDLSLWNTIKEASRKNLRSSTS